MPVYSQPHSLGSFSAASDFPTLDQFFQQEHNRHLEPCRALVARLLEDTLVCISGHATGGNLSGVMLLCYRGEIARETLSWINDTSELPFSFLWCCNILGLEWGEIKKAMLKSADYRSMDIARRMKVSIWKKKGKGSPVRFHGVVETDGKRINIGAFATRKEAAWALSEACQAKLNELGGGSWAETKNLKLGEIVLAS